MGIRNVTSSEVCLAAGVSLGDGSVSMTKVCDCVQRACSGHANATNERHENHDYKLGPHRTEHPEAARRPPTCGRATAADSGFSFARWRPSAQQSVMSMTEYREAFQIFGEWLAHSRTRFFACVCF